MIARFQAKYDLRVDALQVMQQRRPFKTRAHDQQLPARCDEFGDAIEECRIFGHTPSPMLLAL